MRRKPSNARGRLITLEGIEGVGKSTHLEFVARWLREHGHSVLVTREPGGTPTSEEIRRILLDTRKSGLPVMAELLLMFAARAIHVEEVIGPALGKGMWVVCDRFTDATYAYQGGGRGIRPATIAAMEKLVMKGLRPDLTLLLDAPVEVGLARMRGRGVEDRFEREQAAFFRRVRRVYLARVRREPRRIKMITATGAIPEIQAGLAAVLADKVKRWR